MNFAHESERTLNKIDWSILSTCPMQGYRSDVTLTEMRDCQIPKHSEKKSKWPDREKKSSESWEGQFKATKSPSRERVH